MNPSALKMKSLIIDIIANGSVWTGAITTWHDSLDYWVKIIVGLSAIALSWVTIYIRLKKNSDNNNKKDT